MTDALALLALSQLVCLGGLGYLYLHIQELRRRLARVEARLRRQAAGSQDAARPVRIANPARRGEELARLVAQMRQEGADLTTLARRLQRSEEEIRLLLRRFGGVQP